MMALLVIAYTLNFIDRQIAGILAEPIKHDLGLSDQQLGVPRKRPGVVRILPVLAAQGLNFALQSVEVSRPIFLELLQSDLHLVLPGYLKAYCVPLGRSERIFCPRK